RRHPRRFKSRFSRVCLSKHLLLLPSEVYSIKYLPPTWTLSLWSLAHRTSVPLCSTYQLFNRLPFNRSPSRPPRSVIRPLTLLTSRVSISNQKFISHLHLPRSADPNAVLLL